MDPTPHTATMRAIAKLWLLYYTVNQPLAFNDLLDREADALDKQQRCDCGQMTRADCDALPSARHCGKFNEATAGVEQSASADPPPASPSAAERLEQDDERMDAAIEAFHKAWPSFSAWFLRDDEMKIINTPPEPFEAFLEVWNRRPPAPPQPAAQQAEAVKRLREQAGQCTCYACELMREAARECDALRALVQQLAQASNDSSEENTNLRAQLAVAQGKGAG